MDAVDDIAFLVGSEPRAEVLAALHSEGGLGKGTLVERCGAARVTVSRNLEQLADRGLVTARDGGWHLTPLGELLAGALLEMVDAVETADDLAPVLRRLPPDVDLEPGALAGADVTASTAANPYAPAERHAETLVSADRARLVLPAVSAQTMRETRDLLEHGELSLEMVVAPSVARTFREDLADLVEAFLATGQVTIHEHDAAVPFFLGLVDGSVQIGVADEEGIPRALAESEDRAVRSWAEARFESRRETATPFDLDAPSG